MVGRGADQHWNRRRCRIAELAEVIADIVGFKGRFVYDVSKPDGTPRKLLDVAKLTALGWSPRISLEAGSTKLMNRPGPPASTEFAAFG